MKYDRDIRSAILAQPTPTDPERIEEMYREEEERKQFQNAMKNKIAYKTNPQLAWINWLFFHCGYFSSCST